MRRENRRAAVFLDRDGTILDERGYLADPNRLKFYPGIFKALRRLRRIGLNLVVLTNQSGIARGYLTVRVLEEIHRRICQRMSLRGVKLSGFYFCPHLPNQGCSCRKPNPGMPRRAARDFHLNLSRSYVVGDQARDMKLARRIQAKGILVLTGAGRENRKKAHKLAHKVTQNLETASRWIVEDFKKTRFCK